MESPEILIIGPGGSRGFLYIGAIMCCEHAGLLNKVKTVIGVSIGSIIGLLWLAGYNCFQIASECLNFSLLTSETSLFDFNTLIELSKITERWGAFSTAKIEQRLELLVKDKFGLVPTLSQFYMLTGKRFVCVTCNYSKQSAEYLDMESKPDLSVVKAALMSSSIPTILERMVYNNQIYIDGALRDPYPIDHVNDGMTIIWGFYIGTKINADNNLSTKTGLIGMLEFTLKAYSSTMEELYVRSVKNSSKNCRHILLTTATIDTTGITVSKANRISMLATGYSTVLKLIQ